MLARCWWPVQAWSHRHPWTLAIVLAIAALALASEAHFAAAPITWSWAGYATLAAILLPVARSIGPWLGAVTAIALGIFTAADMTPQAPSQTALLAGLGAALAVPVLLALREVRTADLLASAAARGAAIAVSSTGLLLPAAALLGIPSFAAGIGLAVIAVCLAVVPVAWCRARDPEDALRLPTPLLDVRQARPPMLPALRLILVLVASGLVAVAQRAGHDVGVASHPWLVALPVLGIAVWHLTVGSFVLSTAVCAVTLGWLGFATLPFPDLPMTSVLAAGFLAQPLPLALWHARRFQRPWPWWTLVLIGVLCAGPAAGLGLSLAVGGAALAGCLAVAVAARSVPDPTVPVAGAAAPDAVLARARKACQGLEPYGRHYGTAKLRHDPVYRQLAEDRRPWGRALDAGCGPGLVAALAAARGGPAYCGIDLDREKLETAQRTLALLGRRLDQHWQLLRARLPTAHPLPQRFDTAFLLDVLHYWPLDQQRELLVQLHAALVTDGQLMLRDGCADTDGDAGLVGVGERFTTWLGLNPDSGSLHFLDEARMRALLDETGFEVVECLASGGANRLWRCRRR